MQTQVKTPYEIKATKTVWIIEERGLCGSNNHKVLASCTTRQTAENLANQLREGKENSKGYEMVIYPIKQNPSPADI